MLRLSQYRDGFSEQGIRSSLNKDQIHVTSTTVLAKDLYSASAVDLETVHFFFDPHVTRFGPRNTQYPEIDLLSFRSEPQSASQ